MFEDSMRMGMVGKNSESFDKISVYCYYRQQKYKYCSWYAIRL